MSRYDVEICHGGDGEAALTEAKWLVGNHVAYFSRRLEKLGPEPPKQAVLFEMPE